MKENEISGKIIGCAIEVHRHLGPGLLESIYQKAMKCECDLRKIKVETQVTIPIIYKGKEIGSHRLDMLVEDMVIVELKAVDRMDPVFDAQLLSYMKLTGKKVGLLLNFNKAVLKDGISRKIL